MKIHVLMLVALLAIPLFCATTYVRESIVVDSALDSGASYDYVTDRADHNENHPVVPFSRRHRTLLGLSGVLLVSALVYGSVSRQTRAI